MQVFLIRHPRPLIEAGICYGQLDVAAEDPLPTAARLRPLLPTGVALFSSPLRRALRLAETLHAAPLVDPRLMEIGFGDWEGRRWDEIERGAIDAWAADLLHFAPPGGESAARLQRRVAEFADFVTTLSGDAVALVTHSGVMRALLGHWRGLPPEEWSRLRFDFGRLTLIELTGGQAFVRYTNR